MDEKKPVITNQTIITISCVVTSIFIIAQVAWLAGEIRADSKYLSREVDKWDSQVITINSEISALQHKVGAGARKQKQ